MKKIKLTLGKYALVDDEDYPLLSRYNWCAHKTRGGIIYVETKAFSGTARILMHRFILGIKERKKEIDHINRNPLDNRKKNLKVCTHAENLVNRRKFKNKTSKYKGVFKVGNKWRADFSRNGTHKWLGTFKTENQARTAWLEHSSLYTGVSLLHKQ